MERLDPREFGERMLSEGFRFFTGVPDSLLKEWCYWVQECVTEERHIIAANEGGAIGLAGGWHIATGETPVVYLQNSGLGNAVNPLISLADRDVYRIPMLLLIGWRGEPGKHDEPQHVKQGGVTRPMLQTMGIPHEVLPLERTAAFEVLGRLAMECQRLSSPHALVVRSGTFEKYKPSAEGIASSMIGREAAIGRILKQLPDGVAVVATTGMISREVFECRGGAGSEKGRDFLVVGSMGHASQIALGMALGDPTRRICCLDGDGALLMHMGSLATVGYRKPRRFIHVVLNNGAHDSVGGQPTAALAMDLPAIALACGYRTAITVRSSLALDSAISRVEGCDGPHFIEILVAKGHRADLARPDTAPWVAKSLFIDRWFKSAHDGELDVP